MNTRPWWVFGVCFAISLATIATGLSAWGAAEVRASGTEVLFLTIAGVIWLLLISRLFPWYGISVRDDAVERKNIGALTTSCGALMAVAVIYIGGSAGEGSSYFSNLFSVGLGTAGFLVVWAVLELGGKISRTVAEERNLAAGVRLSAFLLSVGLILGRAVAGNWHSETETLRDFMHDGWPAAVLCVLAIGIEQVARPSRSRPFPHWPVYGVIPALLYLAIAGTWLAHLGAWEGKPR